MLLPADCRRVTVAADKDAIKLRLERGEALPGCSIEPGLPGAVGVDMITIGSLFSGYGGLDRGVELGLAMLGHSSRVVWHAEKEPYARAILARHWPNIDCYKDVHDITEAAHRPELICGGFPCQDLSIAGKRAGIDGARSGLWSEFVRVIRVLRPRIVLVENVPELLGYLGRVLGPLAELGFDAEWDLFDAAAVGAPHRRERLFVLASRSGALADADGDRCEVSRGAGPRARIPKPSGNGANATHASRERLADTSEQISVDGGNSAARTGDDGRAQPLADSMLAGRSRPEDGPHERGDGSGLRSGWAPEPAICRVVDGPSSRLDARRRRARLRCLGNGAVEQQVALALVTLAHRAVQKGET